MLHYTKRTSVSGNGSGVRTTTSREGENRRKWDRRCHLLSVYFFFEFLCLCCSPGTMPRRADVLRLASSNNPADKELSDFNEHEAAVMPQAKESGYAHPVKISTPDTNKQALNIDKNTDTGIASGHEINELTDNQDPLELPDDPKTAVRSAEAPWLDYYVQTLKAAAEWTGYNRLTEDGSGDMRAPRRVKRTTETTVPTHAEVTKAAAVHKGNEAARHRQTTTLCQPEILTPRSMTLTASIMVGWHPSRPRTLRL